MKTYRVNEVFDSLQGEGRYQGAAARFLRFSGCNLACAFCDTDHRPLIELTAPELLRATGKPKHPLSILVVTGGEPTLQLDEPLVAALRRQGWSLHLETNGTNPIPGTWTHIAISPKIGAELVERGADEVRICVNTTNAKKMERLGETIAAPWRYVSPECDGQKFVPSSIAAAVKIARTGRARWRLSMQMHKIAGIR